MEKVELQAWIEKYDLKIEEYHCPKCHKVVGTTVPVMTADSAGLQSPVHECGSEYWTAILTPRTKEARGIWSTIV